MSCPFPDTFDDLPTAISNAKAQSRYLMRKLWIKRTGEKFVIYGFPPDRGTLAASVYPGGRTVLGRANLPENYGTENRP